MGVEGGAAGVEGDVGRVEGEMGRSSDGRARVGGAVGGLVGLVLIWPSDGSMCRRADCARALLPVGTIGLSVLNRWLLRDRHLIERAHDRSESVSTRLPYQHLRTF